MKWGSAMTSLPHPQPSASELAQGALATIERICDEMGASVGGGEDGDHLRTAITALRDRARHLTANVEQLSGWGGSGTGLHGGGAGDTGLARLAHLLVRAQDAAELLARSPEDIAAVADLLTAPEPWPPRFREFEERALLTTIEP